MAKVSTVLAVVAALALVHGAAAISQTVPAYGCTGYQFTVALNSYNFTSFMGNYTTPTGCNDTYIKVSKLYVQGACVKTRDNNFGIISSVTNANCETTDNASNTTCMNVIDNGPGNALVYGARPGEVLDSEEVCWPTKSAYMYVYNGCPSPVAVTITATINPYSGSCDVVNLAGSEIGVSKKQFAGIIVGIIVAIIVVVLIIAAIAWCCCCQLRR